MIAVDTSALMCIILQETKSSTCVEALAAETEVLISAATVAEALIVAGLKNIGDAMGQLIKDLNLIILPVTPEAAYRVAEVYALWGKGGHPARLNFGDCFSYDVAKEYSCPLLFIGDDFSKTDLRGVI